jgi:hypothetical protein
MKRRGFFALLLAPFFKIKKKFIHFKEGSVIEWIPEPEPTEIWMNEDQLQHYLEDVQLQTAPIMEHMLKQKEKRNAHN